MDHYLLACFAALATNAFDLTDDLHAFGNVPKYDVLTIEPVSFHSAQEELTTICAWTGIGLKINDVKK